MTFPKGTLVRQIIKPVEGVVAEYNIDQELGTRLLRVDSVDADGTVHSRYFAEDQLEAVPEAKDELKPE